MCVSELAHQSSERRQEHCQVEGHSTHSKSVSPTVCWINLSNVDVKGYVSSNYKSSKKEEQHSDQVAI